MPFSGGNALLVYYWHGSITALSLAVAMCQTNSTQGTFLSSSRQSFLSHRFNGWTPGQAGRIHLACLDTSWVQKSLSGEALQTPVLSWVHPGPFTWWGQVLSQYRLCSHWTLWEIRGLNPAIICTEHCLRIGTQTCWVSYPGMGFTHLTPISCSSGNGFASSAFAFQPCDFSCSGDPTCPVRLSPGWFIPSLSGFVPKCPGPVGITALAHARLPNAQ